MAGQMTKVYVLYHDYGYDGTILRGVTSSEEKAKEWKEGPKANKYDGDPDYDEFELDE